MDQIKSEFANADPFSSWWPFIIAGIVGITSVIRTFMCGQMCPVTNNIKDQIIIVTGGSGGIGLEICKDLCRREGNVIIACKDMEKGKQAVEIVKRSQPTANIEIRNLDLRSFDCIRRFVKSIEKDFDRIDVLINNAGVTFHPFEKTADGFESHLQTNFLGHFLLTKLLLPKLKNSIQGRVINVSAHAYASAKMTIEDPLNIGTWSPAFHPRDAFSHSKLAIVLATKHLAHILKVEENTKVTVNVCTPGLVRGTDHLRRSPLMKAICAKVVTYPWMWLFMKNPTQGAQTIIYLASDPKLSNTTGEYYNDCEISELNELAKDKKLAEKLFKETLRALKLE